MRMFIAFDLAIKVVEKLLLVQEDLHRPVSAAGATPRWTEASNIHLTLKFLGEMEQNQIVSVSQVVRDVAGRHPIFEMETYGIGCFPGPRQPRIIWAGTTRGADETLAMQQDIEDGLAAVGIPREDRPFHPHVTIGRLKTRKGRVDLTTILEPYREMPFGPSQVKDMALFQSILSPKGAIYKVIERFPLTG
ncbi:MAG: RNA 2',3'-cyclic phosphodiesterase [Bradymonadales bacterium]|nr:RNA 2',3'-cyclic phosphodiesterase [Bradymonadales bacterium]